MTLTPIHPFPARMAPELARRSLATVPDGGQVLDPMCGSGTVLRAAVEAGLRCTGMDIDPLAVLMSQVWTTYLEPDEIQTGAEELVQAAKYLPESEVKRTTDPETRHFISYWFAPKQEEEIARLVTALQQRREPIKGVLAIALSRIIVSKKMLASLACDTSHSRPHRVATSNDFDVYAGFLRSSRLIATRIKPELIKGQATISRGDARKLGDMCKENFDLILTSPPYLNAIDYLRGHKLALVWLGYEIQSLRKTRSFSVGAERIMKEERPFDISPFVKESTNSTIASNHLGWIQRYAFDMYTVFEQFKKTLKNTGKVVMVLGNSFIRGAKVDNANLVETLAKNVGFRLESKQVREIPARRRYLPPPGNGQNALDMRMRTEAVLTFTMDT